MAYNHGKAERRWRLWKEKEEKILRECGVDEETIEEIRTFDREEFNSDRRFYTRLNDVGEYIAEIAYIRSALGEVRQSLAQRKFAVWEGSRLSDVSSDSPMRTPYRR